MSALVLALSKLALGLLVVLGGVDAVLVVVDKVEPGHCADEEGRVSALAGSNALQVRAQLALAVEGLTGLDLVNHLAHVHLDLAGVFGGTVEAD